MVMQIYIINRKILTHAIRCDLLERVSDQKQLRVTERSWREQVQMRKAWACEIIRRAMITMWVSRKDDGGNVNDKMAA